MLSNTLKRKTGVRFARSYNLDYKAVYSVVRSIEAETEEEVWTKLTRHYFGGN